MIRIRSKLWFTLGLVIIICTYASIELVNWPTEAWALRFLYGGLMGVSAGLGGWCLGRGLFV
jgi:hypothetical protein